MKITKIGVMSSITLALASCSSISVTNNSEASHFKQENGVATHDVSSLIGHSITVITPKGAALRDHLVQGNITYNFTEPGKLKRRLTSSLETTTYGNGVFLYTKTKCSRYKSGPHLAINEYIDQATGCLMNTDETLPKNGTKSTYQGTYTISNDKEVDIHHIQVTNAKSIHKIAPNIWSGSIILDQEYMATEKGFYDLFTRYNDDKLTFKFPNYSPKALQSAIARHARALSHNEKKYVDYINSMAREKLRFSHGLTLKSNDPMDGIVTFEFTITPYKNHGSFLTLYPSYYPSSREVGESSKNTINFSRQRSKILEMISALKA